MNNARYLRELDFARADFYERTGLYANIKAAGGSVLQAATTIRYRRYLKPFTKFTITSKVSLYTSHIYIYIYVRLIKSWSTYVKVQIALVYINVAQRLIKPICD